MKIIKKGILPNGDNLIIEDWSENYPTLSNRYNVVAYPIAKASIQGSFAPKGGEGFRCGFCFPTIEAAENAFSALETGINKLSDYADNMERADYLPCI